jgi:hypothetical protein
MEQYGIAIVESLSRLLFSLANCALPIANWRQPQVRSEGDEVNTAPPAGMCTAMGKDRLSFFCGRETLPESWGTGSRNRRVPPAPGSMAHRRSTHRERKRFGKQHAHQQNPHVRRAATTKSVAASPCVQPIGNEDGDEDRQLLLVIKEA